jgi:hypothetical protein
MLVFSMGSVHAEDNPFLGTWLCHGVRGDFSYTFDDQNLIMDFPIPATYYWTYTYTKTTLTMRKGSVIDIQTYSFSKDKTELTLKGRDGTINTFVRQ